MAADDSVTVTPVLQAAEPRPFRILNDSAPGPLLLLCDHASRRIPQSLGNLGLDPAALRCHLAWDIGAAATTERLAHSMQATALLAGYSRLVVDCNRQLLDPQAFLEYGDGLVVSGNRGLSDADRKARAAEIFWPYHDAIAAQVERLRNGNAAPVILAIHSFTPVLNRQSRPWEVGILWDKDPRVPDILIPALKRAGLKVGDNEPYSGRAPQDFTIDHHAEAAGLPHAGIEIRQDLVDDERGVNEMAAVLQKAFTVMLDELGSGVSSGGAGKARRNRD